MKKAVIDRIVDGTKAVLLVGDEEMEQVVDVSELPPNVSEGAWVTIEDSGSIVADEQETVEVKERISAKMQMLRNKGQSSQFKK